jgi:hypothetical protein
MADKLAMGNRFTTLEQRFDNAMNRFGHDPEARAAVLRRKDITLALKKKLEEVLGFPVQSLRFQERLLNSRKENRAGDEFRSPNRQTGKSPKH